MANSGDPISVHNLPACSDGTFEVNEVQAMGTSGLSYFLRPVTDIVHRLGLLQELSNNSILQMFNPLQEAVQNLHINIPPIQNEQIRRGMFFRVGELLTQLNNNSSQVNFGLQPREVQQFRELFYEKFDHYFLACADARGINTSGNSAASDLLASLLHLFKNGSEQAIQQNQFSYDINNGSDFQPVEDFFNDHVDRVTGRNYQPNDQNLLVANDANIDNIRYAFVEGFYGVMQSFLEVIHEVCDNDDYALFRNRSNLETASAHGIDQHNLSDRVTQARQANAQQMNQIIQQIQVLLPQLNDLSNQVNIANMQQTMHGMLQAVDTLDRTFQGAFGLAIREAMNHLQQMGNSNQNADQIFHEVQQTHSIEQMSQNVTAINPQDAFAFQSFHYALLFMIDDVFRTHKHEVRVQGQLNANQNDYNQVLQHLEQVHTSYQNIVQQGYQDAFNEFIDDESRNSNQDIRAIALMLQHAIVNYNDVQGLNTGESILSIIPRVDQVLAQHGGQQPGPQTFAAAQHLPVTQAELQRIYRGNQKRWIDQAVQILVNAANQNFQNTTQGQGQGTTQQVVAGPNQGATEPIPTYSQPAGNGTDVSLPHEEQLLSLAEYNQQMQQHAQSPINPSNFTTQDELVQALQDRFTLPAGHNDSEINDNGYHDPQPIYDMIIPRYANRFRLMPILFFSEEAYEEYAFSQVERRRRANQSIARAILVKTRQTPHKEKLRKRVCILPIRGAQCVFLASRPISVQRADTQVDLPIPLSQLPHGMVYAFAVAYEGSGAWMYTKYDPDHGRIHISGFVKPKVGQNQQPVPQAAWPGIVTNTHLANWLVPAAKTNVTIPLRGAQAKKVERRLGDDGTVLFPNIPMNSQITLLTADSRFNSKPEITLCDSGGVPLQQPMITEQEKEISAYMLFEHKNNHDTGKVTGSVGFINEDEEELEGKHADNAFKMMKDNVRIVLEQLRLVQGNSGYEWKYEQVREHNGIKSTEFEFDGLEASSYYRVQVYILDNINTEAHLYYEKEYMLDTQAHVHELLDDNPYDIQHAWGRTKKAQDDESKWLNSRGVPDMSTSPSPVDVKIMCKLLRGKAVYEPRSYHVPPTSDNIQVWPGVEDAKVILTNQGTDLLEFDTEVEEYTGTKRDYKQTLAHFLKLPPELRLKFGILNENHLGEFGYFHIPIPIHRNQRNQFLFDWMGIDDPQLLAQAEQIVQGGNNITHASHTRDVDEHSFDGKFMLQIENDPAHNWVDEVYKVTAPDVNRTQNLGLTRHTTQQGDTVFCPNPGPSINMMITEGTYPVNQGIFMMSFDQNQLSSASGAYDKWSAGFKGNGIDDVEPTATIKKIPLFQDQELHPNFKFEEQEHFLELFDNNPDVEIEGKFEIEVDGTKVLEEDVKYKLLPSYIKSYFVDTAAFANVPINSPFDMDFKIEYEIENPTEDVKQEMFVQFNSQDQDLLAVLNKSGMFTVKHKRGHPESIVLDPQHGWLGKFEVPLKKANGKMEFDINFTEMFHSHPALHQELMTYIQDKVAQHGMQYFVNGVDVEIKFFVHNADNDPNHKLDINFVSHQLRINISP